MERFYCLTKWCEVKTLIAQRYEGEWDLWVVQTDQHDFGWLVASEVPICPSCGGYLLTAANIYEGVDGVNYNEQGV